MAVHTVASMWKFVVDPEGQGMWLRLCDGFTQKNPPFVVEGLPETGDHTAACGAVKEEDEFGLRDPVPEEYWDTCDIFDCNVASAGPEEGREPALAAASSQEHGATART